jgi:hypothetical protein
MRSLIYFTRELPGLSEDLIEKGFQVYEALAVSEALYLCQQFFSGKPDCGDQTCNPAEFRTLAAPG